MGLLDRLFWSPSNDSEDSSDDHEHDWVLVEHLGWRPYSMGNVDAEHTFDVLKLPVVPIARAECTVAGCDEEQTVEDIANTVHSCIEIDWTEDADLYGDGMARIDRMYGYTEQEMDRDESYEIDDEFSSFSILEYNKDDE